MTNIFDQALGAVEAGIIAGVLIIVVLAIGAAFFGWWENNGKAVVKSIAELCGLEDKLYETLEQAFVNDMPDGWGKLVAQRILDGENVSDDEYQILLHGLTIDQKKKLKINVLEISCNFVKR